MQQQEEKYTPVFLDKSSGEKRPSPEATLMLSRSRNFLPDELWYWNTSLAA
jgi:hypothetical protein